MNESSLNQTHPAHAPCRPLLLALALSAVALSTALAADGKYQIVRRTPGGISPLPVITSMTRTQGLVLHWSGIGGPYQVQRKQTLNDASWAPLGSPTDALSLVLNEQGPTGFFRVQGPDPFYTGAETCTECHAERHSDWAQTRHANAFQTLKSIGQEKNASCLACHTVGFGTATGFIDENATPFFAGVQCESCHGPAGHHAGDPEDVTKRPIKELSSMLCGGCHTDAHHPTYEEWETTKHSEVTPTTANYFKQYGEARIKSCGACHSGPARIAMLKGKALPTGEEAASGGVGCAVCHNAHEPSE
ncbi:MAG: cytochrome c family protein, partial [Verrucomicrobiota bacterium]